MNLTLVLATLRQRSNALHQRYLELAANARKS